MILINLIMVILMLIISLIMFLNLMLSKKKFFIREKKTSYECGFDSFNLSRLPFSNHFFLVSLIFLIFDIELSMLFPLIMMFKNEMNYNILFIFYMFNLLFILGLLMEWLDNSLEWMI